MPAAIGGMSIGNDPITAAVVTMSAVRGTPLMGFMVRQKAEGAWYEPVFGGASRAGHDGRDCRGRRYHRGIVVAGHRSGRAVRPENRGRRGDHRPHGRRRRRHSPAAATPLRACFRSVISASSRPGNDSIFFCCGKPPSSFSSAVKNPAGLVIRPRFFAAPALTVPGLAKDFLAAPVARAELHYCPAGVILAAKQARSSPPRDAAPNPVRCPPIVWPLTLPPDSDTCPR